MPDPKSTPLQLPRASCGANRSKSPGTGKQLYDYHWNRIIAALLAALILLAASGYAISLVFTDEGKTSQLFASEAGVEQARGSEQPSGPGPIAGSQTEPGYAPAKAQLDSETSIFGVPLAPAQLAEAAVKPANPITPAAVSNAVFQLEFLRILSPNVARFVLSSAVKDLEPVGSLQDITLHSHSAAKVFAYSAINNMQGEHLSYIWKHQGRNVSTVNIGVGSNRWRSYASKNIEQRLAGDWQFELRDSSDRLLAEAGFTFEPGH